MKVNKFLLCTFIKLCQYTLLLFFADRIPASIHCISEEATAIGKHRWPKCKITLIYGGGNVGIMGTVADEVMKNGGKVIGVIPQVLVEWERQHENISELIIVDDMHTRKRTIYDLCDAAVALPGGFGTLDELFEMLTWNQLSIHDKHIYHDEFRRIL